ncbi:MAG: hypothetical protein ACHQ51_06980 [Elusimicrobiota bacterium]
MPSFSDWLKASWADYKRRWAVLLAVAGAAGAAAMLAGLAPFVPAALATAFGLGPAWAVWGAASFVALLAVLWFMTWAQAAATRAAMTGEKAGECLSRSWKQTGEFGWVLTLALLAVAGGYFLFLIPGVILSVMLFFAGFYQVSGEADGVRALQLSWGRVRPRFGPVALRVVAAGAITAAPRWIPYIGWLLAMFWTPFGLIALSRVAHDLRAADPEPETPKWMGGAVAALSCVFAAGIFLFTLTAARMVQTAIRSFNDPGGLASRIRPETTQALLEAFSGQADEAQKKKAYEDILGELKAGMTSPDASSGTPTVVSSSATLAVP